MLDAFAARASELRSRMSELTLDAVVLASPENVYYVSGSWGHGGMDFERPLLVAVAKSGECSLVTPMVEAEMARAMTWIEDVLPWEDGVDGEWRRPLERRLAGYRTIGIERSGTPLAVAEWLREAMPNARFVDVTDLMAEMRMVKSPEEIETMRQAGHVAIVMADAGAAAVGDGVPEYEVALAVATAGAHRAAELLTTADAKRLESPMIAGLQMLTSGPETSMANRRVTGRRIRHGDPVVMCLCGMAHFKRFKLGFDRTFVLGTSSDRYARAYEVAQRAQATALKEIRPGAVAEEIHAAVAEVYRSAGLRPAARTGHGVGYAFVERPQLKDGDRTILRPGMTITADATVVIPGEFGGLLGDTLLVTETGCEALTEYSRDLRVLR